LTTNGRTEDIPPQAVVGMPAAHAASLESLGLLAGIIKTDD
jgi:hypothetical protein